MRDILDALESIHTNKKKPMDIKKELNKKPAVMKALSLEDTEVLEGTEMGQIGNVHIKQFGMAKGQLGIQLTSDKGEGYVQMSKEDTKAMAERLLQWANSSEPAMPGEYESKEETPEETVNEGGMKQAEIEVQDWVAKYENHTGVNGDELPKGYLQATLNSGIMSDAYDQDEYMAFNKMNGYKDDGDWQEGDMEKFMASSPITSGMFNAIDMIKTKYGIDDEMVNSIMGYFDEGKTINSEEREMETTKKDTVEVAVEDLARVLELAGLGKEVIKAEAEAEQQAEAEATTEAPNEVELDEYSNSPDEDYFDADTQLNKLSGGLNGPKKQLKKEYPGDNPLAVDLETKLAKMLSDM